MMNIRKKQREAKYQVPSELGAESGMLIYIIVGRKIILKPIKTFLHVIEDKAIPQGAESGYLRQTDLRQTVPVYLAVEVEGEDIGHTGYVVQHRLKAFTKAG